MLPPDQRFDHSMVEILKVHHLTIHKLNRISRDVFDPFTGQIGKGFRDVNLVMTNPP